VTPVLRTRMTARDAGEEHRVSTPLELLFDLVFVVAIAQVSAAFAQGVESGDGLALAPSCLTIFFAVWWAWMNFTWFASAYDTGDLGYLVLTVVQMAGVLWLAAGVPAAVHGDPVPGTIGYAIMRAGLILQWVRAGVEYPAGRGTAFRYAVGFAVVQGMWLLRLGLPHGGPWWDFVLLALAETTVPLLAERAGHSSWHPHHIAERYGLFTIILLGESVLASINGVQAAIHEGVTAGVVAVALSGLVLLVALWWTYFSEPSGEALDSNRRLAFFWGYGHFLLFAALTATGAGLEVVVAAMRHGGEADGQHFLAALVGVPVALSVLLVWVLHEPLVGHGALRPSVVFASVAVCASGILVPLPLAVAIALVAMGAVVPVASSFLAGGGRPLVDGPAG